MENEKLCDSRKFREIGEMGNLMEDQFLSLRTYKLQMNKFKSIEDIVA